MANVLLAFVALPIVLREAFRIIRSLAAVKAAARDIAGSVHAVGGSVSPVMTTLGGIAGRCEQLARSDK